MHEFRPGRITAFFTAVCLSLSVRAGEARAHDQPRHEAGGVRAEVADFETIHPLAVLEEKAKPYRLVQAEPRRDR